MSVIQSAISIIFFNGRDVQTLKRIRDIERGNPELFSKQLGVITGEGLPYHPKGIFSKLYWLMGNTGLPDQEFEYEKQKKNPDKKSNYKVRRVNDGNGDEMMFSDDLLGGWESNNSNKWWGW